MPNHIDKKNNLEILISTTKKSNLDFIKKIFSNNKDINIPVLIVNQSDQLIKSSIENINIINSSDIGISKSRNLAIEKSSKKFCLLADDDIIYNKGFYDLILNEFEQNIDADIITFQMENDYGEPFKNYKKIKYHNTRSISDVNSVVIAFKRSSILNNNIQFDSLFGLGSIFETGEEYIFLRDCLGKKLNIISCSKSILKHKSISSGQKAYIDKNIFARSAIFYRFYGFISYFKLIHHIYLLKKKKLISFNQIISKFCVGINGIKRYKSIR